MQFPWARMEQLIFSIMESGSESFLSGHSSTQCSMYGPFVSSSIVFFSGFIFFLGFEVSIRIFFFECMGGDQCISLSYSPSHSYYAAPIFCRKHFFLDQVYFHWNLIIFYFHFIMSLPILERCYRWWSTEDPSINLLINIQAIKNHQDKNSFLIEKYSYIM